jgi:hypothetical protein
MNVHKHFIQNRKKDTAYMPLKIITNITVNIHKTPYFHRVPVIGIIEMQNIESLTHRFE